MGIIRVVAPAPRAGALALLDQPTFGIGSLPPIPAKVSGLTVMSIDLAKSYDLIDRLDQAVSRRDRGSFEPGDHGTTRRGSAQGPACESRHEAGVLYAVAIFTAKQAAQRDWRRREPPARLSQSRFATVIEWPVRSIRS